MNLPRRLSLFSLSVLLVSAAFSVSLVLPLPSHAAKPSATVPLQPAPPVSR